MSDVFSSFLGSPAAIRKFRPHEAVVIYGAGNMGRKVLRVLSKQGMIPIGFIDEYSKSRSMDGIPVYSLSDPLLPRNATVIVAVFNRDKNAGFAGIESNLQAAHFSSIMSFEQFYLSCPNEFESSFYWLANPDYLTDRMNEVRAADALWADERSRQIYRSQIGFRITGNHELLPKPNADSQYKPDDVPLVHEPYRFVDIGAFDGDTLESLKKQNVVLDSILAFEPDMRNFQALVKRVSTFGPYASQTILMPCGVGRRCGTVVFSEDGAESSKIVEGSPVPSVHGSRIPVVSLDEMLVGYRPNYIKFDVEGAEEDALYGMRKTIETDRPMLAVSVYHRPADIFGLPLLLSSWNYPADYYLRMHGEHTFDTVFYAIPRLTITK